MSEQLLLVITIEHIAQGECWTDPLDVTGSHEDENERLRAELSTARATIERLERGIRLVLKELIWHDSEYCPNGGNGRFVPDKHPCGICQIRETLTKLVITPTSEQKEES